MDAAIRHSPSFAAARVMTQSRNPAALEAWIRQIMPGETGGASGAAGVLGGLLGR